MCIAPPEKQHRISGRMISLIGVSVAHLLSAETMPRLASKSNRWLAQAAGLQAKSCQLRHPREDPSLLSSVPHALRQLLTNAWVFVNKKHHLA
jgi:hypothetical protein